MAELYGKAAWLIILVSSCLKYKGGGRAVLGTVSVCVGDCVLYLWRTRVQHGHEFRTLDSALLPRKALEVYICALYMHINTLYQLRNHTSSLHLLSTQTAYTPTYTWYVESVHTHILCM